MPPLSPLHNEVFLGHMEFIIATRLFTSGAYMGR